MILYAIKYYLFLILINNRIWSEIITKRNYFNSHLLFTIKNSDIKKADVLSFFDKIFTNKLQKLSVQEFSKKVDIPQEYKQVRDFKPVPATWSDFFRKRAKFLAHFKQSLKEKVLRITKEIK